MPSPSLKKLGKRPAFIEMDGIQVRETNQLTQSPGVTTTHQKRVLPSRSRRGGPGIGNCSVDQLIIDTERRARDARPVIPPIQEFFLTTYSKAVPPPPEASAPDGEAVGSYFDQPEVKAAYLAARAIQVPEFSPLPDDAVGGRLRARAEEEGPETSDDAYLARHRKYETFEKRQRRREKEKLVHERYKLKERIEQLKGMDATAFGAGGETRRKDMLDVAEDLEMRYAVLLPPDPKRIIKKEDKRKSNGPRADTATGDDADEHTDVGDIEDSVVVDAIHPAPTGTRSIKARKSSVRVEPQPPILSRMPAVSVALASESPRHDISTVIPGSRMSNRVRDPTGLVLQLSKTAEPKSSSPPPSKERSASPAVEESAAPPPRKRQRVEKRAYSPEANPITTSVLLQIAARKAAQPQARQTSRTTLAFGYRVPPEAEEHMYFDLPEWLVTSEELERIHERRAQSATRSPSPDPLGHSMNGVELPKEGVTQQPEANTTAIGAHHDVEYPKKVEVLASGTMDPLVNGADEAMEELELPTSSLRGGEEDIVMAT